MVVSSENKRNEYTGTGATDTFAYQFRILSKNDLLVVERDLALVETTLTVDIDYTVTGVGDAAGGNIVRIAGNLPAGYKIIIRRDPSLTQETSFKDQGSFFPSTHEDAFDKHAMISQKLQDEIDRSVKGAETDGSVDFSLPPVEPDKAIMTNSGGTGFDLVAPGSVALAIPADLSVSTAKIVDDAVDKDKINADVAGDGLVQAAGGELDVNVDDSTIEINADTVRVKALGIDTAHLAADAVDKDKIAADVAGDGLGQNVDGSLEAKVDDSTIEINADTLRVKASGITANELSDLNQNMLDAISNGAAPTAANPFLTESGFASALAADHQQFVVAAGAGWSVSTGALSFTPQAVLVHWAYAQTDTVAGWGVAMGTGAGDQNGISMVWDIGAVGEPLYAFTIDANDIMGFENTAGGTGNFTTAFDESARVTNFDATGVTITTQTGTWGGSNLYINMLIWGG